MSDYLNEGFDANLSRELGFGTGMNEGSGAIRNPLLIDTENANEGKQTTGTVLKLIKTISKTIYFPTAPADWAHPTVFPHGLKFVPDMVYGRCKLHESFGQTYPWLPLPVSKTAGAGGTTNIYFGMLWQIESYDAANINVSMSMNDNAWNLYCKNMSYDFEFKVFQEVAL